MKFLFVSVIFALFALQIPAQTPNAEVSTQAVEVSSAPRSLLAIPPEKKVPITIKKFDVPPVIDGVIDEEIWRAAPVFKDFVQISPGDNNAPSKPTEVWVGYDEKNLYVAFKCYDERDKVRATVGSRDGIFGEDNVRLWLDTYNDQRRAYIIGFNPYGIQQDGIYTEGQGTDFSVDVVMESKGTIQDWGWSVEAKIPFKSLRYVAGSGKLWGFNIQRNIDRFNDELDSWMPDDRNITGSLIEAGKITGLDEIKTERTLEIVPTVTIAEAGNRVRTIPRYLLAPNVIDPGRFVNEPITQAVGVTAKFVLTPNVTLDAAINPDFAEVEADAPVVTANQRFPLFFTEKRPFFLEGAEIFQSPLQVFYSRTIIDPDAAVKLSGKTGKTSFGFLAATDKAPGNYPEDDRNDPSVRPRIDEFLDKNATFGVVRLRRDFGKENNIGFFGTYRGFPEQKNILGGFDGRIKWNDRTVSQFQIVGTNSRRCFFDFNFEPSLNPLQAQRNREICGGSTYNKYRTGNGIGYTANLDYTELNKGFYLQVTGRTRDYRADAGFTRRTNTNNFVAAGRLSTAPRPKAQLVRFSVRPRLSANIDFKGRIQDLGAQSEFEISLQKNLNINFEAGVYNERIYEEEFGLKRTPRRNGAFFGEGMRSAWQEYFSGNINKQFSKRFSTGAFVGVINNAFDFDFGGGDRYPRVSPSALTGDGRQDPGASRQFDMELYASFRPTDPFRLSLEYTKSHLVRNDTKLTAFDSNIVTLNSTYQFTRFVFVRSRAVYDTLNSNASGQFLFGWNPNPGTAFYAGYNDNFNYNGFNPYTGQLEPRFERNNRTFFIRASYLIRRSF